MILTTPEVASLRMLAVLVRGEVPTGPRRAGKATALAGLRAAALERLTAAAGIEGLVLHERDLLLRPSQRGSWWASWAPSRLVTELDGGPKDGATIALPSYRPRLEFRSLAPSWLAAAAAGYPLPKVSYVYEVAGYDPGRALYVHRYVEN